MSPWEISFTHPKLIFDRRKELHLNDHFWGLDIFTSTLIFELLIHENLSEAATQK